ncbi:MAG TPA: hypothetical protein VFO34_04355 [Candidatus Acidoferrales bacterium]|nr:hypothetical protein [Candidatus Acidoferrales bacterium]
MSQTASIPVGIRAQTESAAIAGTSSVPWTIWCGVIGIISIVFGLYWDISWHQTIGRDTFWTPAHLALQFGGVMAAAVCTYLIFSTTFGDNASARDASVRVWGFRGPLGAFLTAWGGVMMVTSAPFDNWWHNAFGLDVQILSPPHVVLALGFLGVVLGILFLTVSEKNRAEGSARIMLDRLLLVAGGFMMVLALVMISEYTSPNQMHTARFYLLVSIFTPTILLMLSSVSERRWAATKIAAIYSALMLAGLWIFPLFPAQPRLGPVYTKVTHMVPMEFPLLIIAPAILIDLLRPRIAARSPWVRALILGPVFVIAMVIVQWPFANFMVSPAARNYVFGMANFPYPFPPSQYHFVWEFQPAEPTKSVFALWLFAALAVASLSSWLGIRRGEWLQRLRR